MSDHLSNPTSSPTPPPIDEGDLLALIEGVSIPAERAAWLREALSSDPRLAELAALMRADREVIASLPAVSAPSDLLDRVEAVLERDALVGLARTEAASLNDELPVSAVVPAGKVWFTRRVGAPMAAAAAVLLISGGVLMMIPGKKPVIPAPAPDETLATNNTAKPPVHSGTDLAHGAGVDPTIKPEAGSPSLPTTDVAANAVTPTSDNPIPDRPIAAKAISTEALLLAASEGRLVLRVRADDQGAKARVDAANVNIRSLRLDPLDGQRSSQVSLAFAGAFNARPASIEPVKPIVIPEAAPLAGSNPGAVKPVTPLVASETPAPIVNTPPAPVLSQKAYLAYVPAAAESLETLRKSMGTSALPAEWQVLPSALSFEPPTDAASILWWTAQPAAWSSRFSVPVVVQHN